MGARPLRIMFASRLSGVGAQDHSISALVIARVGGRSSNHRSCVRQRRNIRPSRSTGLPAFAGNDETEANATENAPEEIPMYKASAGVVLPTSIIGSLPRPSWYNAVLGSKSFLEAMINARYREQYEDAVSSHLRAQETAGLDICTDGDAHYDEEVGGMSWQSYPLTHMAGFSREVALTPPAVANAAPPRGTILHDQLEARVLPRIVGPLGPGNLQ